MPQLIQSFGGGFRGKHLSLCPPSGSCLFCGATGTLPTFCKVESLPAVRKGAGQRALQRGLRELSLGRAPWEAGRRAGRAVPGGQAGPCRAGPPFAGMPGMCSSSPESAHAGEGTQTGACGGGAMFPAPHSPSSGALLTPLCHHPGRSWKGL